MQAALQPLIDGAIAEAINLAPRADAAEVDAIYREAFKSGLKGCTVCTDAPTRTPSMTVDPIEGWASAGSLKRSVRYPRFCQQKSHQNLNAADTS